MRAAGIVLGVLADAVLADPRHGHPVALFGSWAQAVERHTYADDRGRGLVHWVVCVTPVAALGVVAERASRRHAPAHTAATALATWACLGAASLGREAEAMADHLDAADLDAARGRLSHLCSRDPSTLDAPELARAATESVAENAGDAVVATLMWGALAGIPVMLVHRAANTLDAMVGYRSPRYRRFGMASARIDDVLAFVPARLTGALACALAGSVGGDSARAWATMRRDAADHPSPNAGWCEAAWAGALGVRLGGANTYDGAQELRGTLGDPDAPRPDAGDLRRARRLLRRVTVAATGLAAVAASLSERRSPCPGS